MVNSNQLQYDIGQAVQITVGVFKDFRGFVADRRDNDNSYLLKAMFPEKDIPAIRWYFNEIKPT